MKTAEEIEKEIMYRATDGHGAVDDYLVNHLNSFLRWLQPKEEWISVETAKPEQHVKVLVYFKGIDNVLMGRHYDNIGWKVFYSDGETYHDPLNKNSETITHWRELPPSPTH